MMNVKDVKRVISNLQSRPFICGENEIVLDNGYVILKKAYYENMKTKEKDK